MEVSQETLEKVTPLLREAITARIRIFELLFELEMKGVVKALVGGVYRLLL